MYKGNYQHYLNRTTMGSMWDRKGQLNIIGKWTTEKNKLYCRMCLFHLDKAVRYPRLLTVIGLMRKGIYK